jgi:hypothetical protein
MPNVGLLLLALSGASAIFLGCGEDTGTPPARGASARGAGASSGASGRAAGGSAATAGGSAGSGNFGTGGAAGTGASDTGGSGTGGTNGASGTGAGGSASTGTDAGDGALGTGGSNGTAGSGSADAGDAGPPFDGQGDPWTKPAPRATCRSGDKPETGLQGLGTDVRCNVDIKGQVAAEHFLSLAWYGNCAYVNGAAGTSVVDVSNAASPRVVTTLTTPGMQSNWESMKVHEGRGLLVGYQSNAPILDIYDVKADCKAPLLKRTHNLGGSGHSGNFSPDGTIYYASSLFTSQVFAVELTDPANPSVITTNFERTTHDLFIGKNGTRGYFVFSQLVGFATGSLAILDTSQVQTRAANARATLIKEITWPDGSASQYPIPLTYRGRDYLVMTDELGSGSNCLDPTKPQFGYARIFDIQDERNPTLVSKIKTEAQDPANCVTATADAGTFFGVGTHYCNVDRRDDPRLLSCGLWAGGVRLFDIRNPWRPKEVAYFNVPGTQVPGLTRIRVAERELWVATPNTFYVLSLPEAVVGPILGG